MCAERKPTYIYGYGRTIGVYKFWLRFSARFLYRPFPSLPFARPLSSSSRSSNNHRCSRQLPPPCPSNPTLFRTRSLAALYNAYVPLVPLFVRCHPSPPPTAQPKPPTQTPTPLSHPPTPARATPTTPMHHREQNFSRARAPKSHGILQRHGILSPGETAATRCWNGKSERLLRRAWGWSVGRPYFYPVLGKPISRSHALSFFHDSLIQTTTDFTL
jgi:hypothetical protein